MNYEYVSDNIIICKNFLPDTMLQKIKIDLMNNRGNFGIPNWSDRAINLFNSKCGGLDYWITEDEIRDIAIRIVDEMVLEELLPDCIDTNDFSELQAQDIIVEQLTKVLTKGA